MHEGGLVLILLSVRIRHLAVAVLRDMPNLEFLKLKYSKALIRIAPHFENGGKISCLEMYFSPSTVRRSVKNTSEIRHSSA